MVLSWFDLPYLVLPPIFTSLMCAAAAGFGD